MTERDVVEPGERARRHLASATDHQLALGGRRRASGHECVRHHHGAHPEPGSTIKVVAAPGDCAAQDRSVGAQVGVGRRRVGGKQRTYDVRLEVGHGVERHLAVGVLEDDRLGATSHLGADVHASLLEQSRPTGQPAGRVVVAADHDDGGTGVGQPLERLAPQLDGVDRWQRPVVEITRNQDGVDTLGPNDVHEPVDHRRLRTHQVDPVKGATQVPVGRVQQPHDATVGIPTDTIRCGAPTRFDNVRAPRCESDTNPVPSVYRFGYGNRLSAPGRRNPAT